jgi:hypothetical protein
MAIYNIGTGSGTITIDGSKVVYKAGDTIKIKAGKYTGMVIKNINITNGYVNIINDGGVVDIAGSLQYAWVICSFTNISGVNISGNGTPGIDKGFYFHDNRYRMIEITGINGILKNFTLQNVKFENIGDYNIFFNNFNTVYNGTDATISSNLKFLNIEVIGTNLISGPGDPQNMKGFLKGLEIANCNFHDIPVAGTLVYWAGVEDYDIHDNIINNINTQNDNHNGIFMLIGNGKIYNNKITNHQGNLIRAWGITLGTTPKNIEIYNNIVYNSRKYGGFELQVPPYLSDILKTNVGKLTFTNSKVYNNTVGKMNTSRDWDGLILDLYNMNGGTLEYYNNLGFDLYRASGVPDDMINNMSDVKFAKKENNIYKVTQQEAVTDTTTFKSLIPGVGANESTIPSVPTIPITYKNVVISQQFTRNDCNSNQTGSTVTYQVVAGKYTSTISQEDANQKALNDINSNGQSYANINGICTNNSNPDPNQTVNISIEDFNSLKSIINKYNV